MTVRRFNYTGCKKIGRTDVVVATRWSGGSGAFAAEFDLSEYELPSDAEVVIEAYVDWTVMRFPFGTIAQQVEPADVTLTEFESPEGLRFRMKVLGVGDNAGLILAEADKLRPADAEHEEEAESFIVARPTDLGDVTWRLVFDDSQAILQVNKKLGDWKSFLRRAAVRALVLPEVLRQVLEEAVGQQNDEEDTDSWQAHAIRFAQAFSSAPLPSPDDEEEIERWCDDIVRRFARQHKLFRGVSDLQPLGETE